MGFHSKYIVRLFNLVIAYMLYSRSCIFRKYFLLICHSMLFQNVHWQLPKFGFYITSSLKYCIFEYFSLPWNNIENNQRSFDKREFWMDFVLVFFMCSGGSLNSWNLNVVIHNKRQHIFIWKITNNTSHHVNEIDVLLLYTFIYFGWFFLE